MNLDELIENTLEDGDSTSSVETSSSCDEACEDNDKKESKTSELSISIKSSKDGANRVN